MDKPKDSTKVKKSKAVDKPKHPEPIAPPQIKILDFPDLPKFELPDLPVITLPNFSNTFELPILSTTISGPSGYRYHLEPSANSGLGNKLLQLNKEIAVLRSKFDEQRSELLREKSGSNDYKNHNEALELTLANLTAKERLGFLLSRVHPKAHAVLTDSDTLRSQFEQGDCLAFVMSVDIRRSTELMLKARTAEAFARFTTDICSEFSAIVLEELGVFDKFTGDGILAFFPTFYSGEDAAYRVLSAADRCHHAFLRHYQQHRKSFTSILVDVGLGIGIDYGLVRLVKIAGGLTVVGVPVVYACRLSGAPPNATLVNQPAFELINERFGRYCFSQETSLEIKHEGRMLAYALQRNGHEHQPALPEWLIAIQDSAVTIPPVEE